LVFSLSDGLLGYTHKGVNLPKPIIDTLADSFLYFPSISGVNLKNFMKTGEYADTTFLTSIANFIRNARVYYPEPTEYF